MVGVVIAGRSVVLVKWVVKVCKVVMVSVVQLVRVVVVVVVWWDLGI